VRSTWLIASCLAATLAGCAQRFVYSGSIDAADSTGVVQPYVIYWTKTDRPLWFDTSDGSVHILPCNPNVLDYDERPSGIVFRGRASDKPVIGSAAAALSERICGRVLGPTRVADLGVGVVKVTVWCEDAPQDELDRPKPYLRARAEPYEFPVSRREVSDFSAPGSVPLRPTCRAR
jgi:hypothetical protein